MRDRKTLAIVAALGAVALFAHHPTANIQVMTHDAGDPAPHRMQAAIDLGLVGVSVLYTWTVKRLQ